MPRPKAFLRLTTIRNGFSALEVEDVDDAFEISPTDVALATGALSTNANAVDVYILEEDKAFAENFAIFCFFEDLH